MNTLSTIIFAIIKMESTTNYDTNFRGLENKHGKNNCYLNVVIQSLWHLLSFRINFISHKNHRHSDKELILRHKRNKLILKRSLSIGKVIFKSPPTKKEIQDPQKSDDKKEEEVKGEKGEGVITPKDWEVLDQDVMVSMLLADEKEELRKEAEKKKIDK